MGVLFFEYALAFSPDFDSDKTIFVGTTNSGVVRSTNGGTTWNSVGLAGLNVNALTFASSDSNPILFAGTAKGIYRSIDNGDTWQPSDTGLGGQVVVTLVVSPNFASDGRLFAGTKSGLYTSTDGGNNWTFLSDTYLPGDVYSAVLHPNYAANNLTLYVGRGKTLGVARSTNAGAGEWEILNTGLAALSIGDIIIWSNLSGQTALLAGGYGVGLYRSDDQGASWRYNSGVGLPEDNRIQSVAVSPQYNTDRTLLVSIQYKGIYRSTDGGVNWMKINDPTWPTSPEVKNLAMSPAFSQDGTVFASVKDRGIYRRTKNQTEWTRVYEPGPGIEVRSLEISPLHATDFTLFASIGDQVRYTDNRGESWTQAQNGFPNGRYDIIALPPNFGSDGNNTVFAALNHTNILYRSTNGGVDWSRLEKRFPTDSVVNALIFSPGFGTTDSKMYAGLDQGVYVSEDRGDSWQALSGGVPIWDVLSLVVSQGLAPKLYAGIEGGSVLQYDIERPSPNLICDDVITGSVTLDTNLQCSGTALTVNAPSGATIDCAGHELVGSYPAQPNSFGIQIIGSTGVTIRNCKIRKFKTGVAFQGSSGNSLLNSELRANGIGVWMTSLERAGSEQTSTDNTVSSNLFASNGFGLMLSAGADRNRLIGNTVQNSSQAGIDTNNTQHTLITGNTIYGGGARGISILKSNFVTVTANSVLSHTIGVSINGNGGLFTGNTWRDNVTGVEVVDTSANNLIYNNLFSNSTNLVLGPSVGLNSWHVAQRSGPNVIGGPLLGGNFWGKPGNDGFSQTCTDTQPDGLCDTFNELGSGNRDQLPLAVLTGLADCVAGPQWAILVYLNGDNDLDFWTARLFNRLEQVARNPCIQIRVLWDRAEIGDSNLYLVQSDGNPYALADYVEDVNRWSYGEVDMGNPQTLINFVNRSRTAFETPYTMLSIVGHGNGWSPSSTATPRSFFHSGISFDDSGGGTSLSTDILGAALGEISANGADPIDLLYLDACLMAMAETLHPLQGFASYVVASENESFTSYPYERYLGGISSATAPASLANTIVTEHHQSLPGYPRTLAAFDMAQMPGVTSALNGFADAMLDTNNQIEAGLGDGLLAIFDDVQKLDSNVDLLVDDRDGYVDLFHFASLVEQRIGNGNVQNAAIALQNALIGPASPLITSSRVASGTYAARFWDLSNANGLSIYLPLGEKDWRQDFYNANELSLARDTLWDEFVRALAALKDSGDTVRPTPITDDTKRPGPLHIYDVFLPSLNR